MSTTSTLSASEQDAIDVSRAIYGQRTRVHFATELSNNPSTNFVGQIVGQSHDYYLQRIFQPGHPEPQILAHPQQPFCEINTPLAVGQCASIRYKDDKHTKVAVMFDEPQNFPGADPHLWAMNQFLVDYVQRIKQFNAGVIIPQGPTLAFKGEIVAKTGSNYIQELDKTSPDAPTYVAVHSREKISPELSIGTRCTVLYQNHRLTAYPEELLQPNQELSTPSTPTAPTRAPHLFGGDYLITDAETSQGLYTGPIVSQSSKRYIQQTGPNEFVGHHKDLIHDALPADSALAQGPLVTINYRSGRAIVRPENCVKADLNDAVYIGDIALQTTDTYYQRITPTHYVAHDKNVLNNCQVETSSPATPKPETPGLTTGNRYYVTYSQGTPNVTDITQQQPERTNTR